MPTPVSMKKRLFVLKVLFLLGCFLLVLSLGYWQLHRGPELARLAIAQLARGLAAPQRGMILSRNLRELAVSAHADTLLANPGRIRNPNETAAKLAAVLNLAPDDVLRRITRDQVQVYVARQISVVQATAIRELNLPGIGFKSERKRYFPNGNLASHILGFVGMDNQGLNGLELVYDAQLAGSVGEVRNPADGQSLPSPNLTPVNIAAVDGNNIILTIDEVIQHIVERELDVAMERHNATGALAVAMNPKTGEILALANRPDFDPNNFRNYSEALWRNTAVSDSFEPGSTFKVVTAAAALNEGMVSESDRSQCPGFVIVSGVRLACWRAGGHGDLSFEEVFWRSCNPGFVNAGMKLGKETLFSYIDRFGFGRRTGIDLPGEAPGVMFRRVGPVELATTSFGQGPAFTAIQQVVALSAAVNGGTVFRPRLVKEIRDPAGKVVESFPALIEGQAITAETSERVRRLLEGAVLFGSGRNAAIEGHRIGGKTGTAQVPKDGGGYYADRFISSFIGMAPADDPSIVLLVIVREPKGPYGYFGSQVAAPAFRAMLQDILRYYNVPPASPSADLAKPALIAVPELRGLTTTAALAHLRDLGLNLRLEKVGDIVIEQSPKPGEQVSAGTTIVVDLGRAQPRIGKVAVLAVTGLSMRDASLALANVGLRIVITGSGVAVSQDPLPGRYVDVATVVRVTFSP